MTETLSGSAQGSQEPGIQSSPEAQGTVGAHSSDLMSAWEVDSDFGHTRLLIRPKGMGYLLAEVPVHALAYAEGPLNAADVARLIAKVPTMLVALEKLRNELRPETNPDPADAANFAAVIVKNALAELGR